MLVWRRAANARSLLVAAAAAALIATCLVAGLAEYNRAVVLAGGQAAVAAAPPDERSILVRGPAGDAAAWASGDQAVRAQFTSGLGGVPATVATAGVASGRQFAGPTGSAVPDSGGLVFARVMFADRLADHGRLVEGAWAVPGATPTQTVIGEAAARQLGLTVGSRVPINDRIGDKVTEVVITGVFAAGDVDDPYWLMMPDLPEGAAPGGSTYGPLVLDRSDYFGGGWASSGSAAWIVEPAIGSAGLDQLLAVRNAVRTIPERLPKEVGFGAAGLATTKLDRLVDRLQRADLVGRSALLTPLLLIVVLGGYALMLLASLLTEQRVAETALLRARGAARHQLGWLATQEAMLVALPAALLAPPLVGQALAQLRDLPSLAATGLRLDETLTPLTWAVGALAAGGCVLAMALPALRGGGTYVADLAARSRPSRAGVAQRAGLDLALVGFAVLAWFQLRQYQSPLSGAGGALGIDPMLAAAAPIAVLAGAVLALRLLPPLTRLAERLVDRRPWFATQLGTWQAGRRPHAGPVLLLALAVAVNALAWTLAATSERSVQDQANHLAGIDLRLAETSNFAPAGRPQQLSELPGVAQALPGWRSTVSLGEKSTSSTVLAFDATAARDNWQLRSDLGDPRALLGTLAEHRPPISGAPLPAGSVSLSGRLAFVVADPRANGSHTSTVTAVLMDAHGGTYRTALGERTANAPATGFEAKLPGGVDRLALVGFEVDGLAPSEAASSSVIEISWRLAELAATDRDGGRTPVAAGTDWKFVPAESAAPGEASGSTAAAGDTLTITYQMPTTQGLRFAEPRFSFVLAQRATNAPVPAIADTEALGLLRKKIGDEVAIQVGNGRITLKLHGEIASVPGAGTGPVILMDLPSAAQFMLTEWGQTQSVQEWWLTTEPGGQAAAVQAADRLDAITVYDRVRLAEESGRNPYSVGARIALFVAAIGAIALALVGVAVDVRATARRRVSELAVLHTLGATPRLLARALVIEQGLLAGLGVPVGLVVGIGVAATMAPLVILTPTADRPTPVPLIQLDWAPVLGMALLLLLLAMLMAGLVATSLRQRLAAAQLRIGADR